MKKKHIVIITILLVALLSLLSCKADISASNPPYVPPQGNFIVFYGDTEFSITPYNSWSGGPKSALEFSTDNSNWKPLDITNLEVKTAVKTGDKYFLYFRGTDINAIGTDDENYWVITGNNVYCSGNIENLLDYADVSRGEHPKMGNACFAFMFNSCTSLVSAPELPTMTLTSDCYSNMFEGCTSLLSAPALPATSLVEFCYSSMFERCTKLQTTPELPANSLAKYCYSNMFEGCTELRTAPALSANSLVEYCYSSMFKDCTSLVSAPALSANSLAEYCYSKMFEGCTSLVSAPALPATKLTEYCYNYMFYNCEKLNSITCLATDISATGCIKGWLANTATVGTFIKAKDATVWSNAVNGNVQTGWTIKDQE